MKKLLLIPFVAFCVNLGVAQTITAKSTDTKAKKETVSAVKLKKDGTPDKRYTSKPSVATDNVASSTSTKLKKDGTPDKRYATQRSATANTGSVKLKKDGTPDKRYSTGKEQPVSVPTQNQSVSRPSVSTINSTKGYTPSIDRTLKGPNGEEILTGPRGGKYYINKNGNKTYLKR